MAGQMLKKLIQDFSLSAFVAGLIAIMVSFSGPAIIIFQAAKVANLSTELVTSWIFAISIASGLAGLLLSLRYKLPIICAWSTPGAALLVLSLANYSYQEAIGAFILSALLITLLGITGVFEKIMDTIPIEIVAALLAGVLLRFGLDLFVTLENDYIVFLIMFFSYYLTKKINTRYSVIVSLLVGVLYAFFSGEMSIQPIDWTLTKPIFTMPIFSLTAFFGLALPIFIVTMASQNAPGVSVLRTAGYKQIPVSPLITSTGLLSLIFAPFGSHAINLAAITAAICTNEESHANKNKRYIAGVVCGFLYILVGLFSGVLIAFFFSIPSAIISVITGLALLGSIISNLSLSVQNIDTREAAVITFLMTASNITVLGIGSAFWGIIMGVVLTLFLRKK